MVGKACTGSMEAAGQESDFFKGDSLLGYGNTGQGAA